ncbi:hypothetical protein [Marivirga arenosa]|uniref:Uncharacterized protein n=1 Tax=Marivirga arenosa TaxID=3059076 RepID=A0AA49GEN2_9BACT|nr:hypothetical protein [Marivirga sp. BKB1-2]WKK80737.2 hypothetical protein QYS47_27205 [Marivirga sp. BKB1-2]
MKRIVIILAILFPIMLGCDEVENLNTNDSVNLADLSDGEGKVIVYGEVSDSFTGNATIEETNTFLGVGFDPDNMLDEYTVAIISDDFSASLQLRFFLEYPESAAENIELFAEKYNIIDLNDTNGGGVLYAYPLLQISTNREISHSSYPDGANNYAEIVSVTSDIVEGRLFIEGVENSEGKTYTIEAAFKAERQ